MWYKARVMALRPRFAAPKVSSLLLSFPPTPNHTSSARAWPGARAASLLAALADEPADLPIAWHVAADAVAGPDQPLAKLLADRIASHEDRFLPMGLTGAAHLVLHEEEIEADLSWAVKNLWSTGARDTLRVDPPLVVPCCPDTFRREALGVYGRAEVPVGLLVEARDGAWLAIVPNGEGAAGRAIPVVEVDPVALAEPGRRTLARSIARRRRASRAARSDEEPEDAPVLLRIVVSSRTDLDSTVSAIRAIAEAAARGTIELVPFDPASAAAATLGPTRSSDVPPVSIAAARTAGALRRRRGSRINTRRVLEAFASSADPEQFALDASGVPRESRREFIASMMGIATIPGAAIEARFDSGRFCGISGLSSAPATGRPARALLASADAIHEDVVASCFSFETEISRGLRAEAVIVDEGSDSRVDIRTEYALVADDDAVVASQHVLTAGGSPGEIAYPLAAPVIRPDTCVITGRFTDGSYYDLKIDFVAAELVLWGEAFGIWDGESRYTLLAMDTDGNPVPWPVVALRDPEPRIVLGGRYPLGQPGDHLSSLLLARTELDDELVTKALTGRLPSAIKAEIAAGAASGLEIRERLNRARQEA